MKFILGRKRGMTQLFEESGRVYPVTVVEAGPCVVTQVKSAEKDGYAAVQIGFEDVKESRLSKPVAGRLKKANLPLRRHFREQRIKGEATVKVGDEIKVSAFEKGDIVDVIGKSKGKGFQGTIRAHHFNRGPETHGSMNVRQPGTVSSGTGLSRVLPGLRMAKHLGDVRSTTKNLEVVRVDPEKNLLFLCGPVPGMTGSLVTVCKAKTGVKKTVKQVLVSKADKAKGAKKEEKKK